MLTADRRTVETTPGMDRIIEFCSGDLSLEGRLCLPERDGLMPMVVVLHPHPRYGGSQDNDVVVRLCESMTEAGVGSLRFNFRGVGRSEGSYGGGVDEEQDVAAAIEFVQSIVEAQPGAVGLAGYSFGANLALSVGQRNVDIRAIAAISLADFLVDDRMFVASPTCKLLVSGEKDHLLKRARLEEIAGALAAPVDLEIYKGADHFWGDQTGKMAQRVAEYFANELTLAAAA